MGELALVEHQRLSGSGYCFSASLPPYLASAAIDAVKRIETPDGQAAMIKLAAVAAALRQGLSSVPGGALVLSEMNLSNVTVSTES